MSISTHQSRVQSAQKDIADLQGRLSAASRKEGEKLGKIAQLQSRSTSSASALQSKLRDIARLQEDIARSQKDQSDLNKKIADKTRDLHRYETELRKEEERDRKKVEETERRRRQEHDQYHRSLSSLRTRPSLPMHSSSVLGSVAEEVKMSYDLFISHASEDKEGFVRPLADALVSLGVRVWYDEFRLQVGDSLRRSIDRGLTTSRFGVVVLSSSFFAKNWPQYELDGMVAKEMNGVKVILPIWHKVSKNEVMSFSPTLADKVALNSSMLEIAEIARELANVVRQ